MTQTLQPFAVRQDHLESMQTSQLPALFAQFADSQAKFETVLAEARQGEEEARQERKEMKAQFETRRGPPGA